LREVGATNGHSTIDPTRIPALAARNSTEADFKQGKHRSAHSQSKTSKNRKATNLKRIYTHFREVLTSRCAARIDSPHLLSAFGEYSL
jgi:hypothetical protein